MALAHQAVLLATLGLFGSAVAETQASSADVAVVEATRKCEQNDYEGMQEVLLRHGGPLGFEQSKALLRSCFADSDGQCLLGPSRCAWMKKCLMAEGPCEQVPIAEAFEELGGEEAFIELMEEHAKENATDAEAEVQVDIPVEKLTDAAKKVMSLVEQESKPAVELAKAAEATKAKKPGLLRLNRALKAINNTRYAFMGYFPEDSQRKWAYNVLSLVSWIMTACGTSFEGVKTAGFGNKEAILYTRYAPLGKGKPGESVGPVYNTKFNMYPQDWSCKTGTHLWKKGIWENQYGTEPGKESHLNKRIKYFTSKPGRADEIRRTMTDKDTARNFFAR